ncbi:ATP-dependent zinc metalloprotease FTSH 10, mitochondrial-like, partial [Pistacia vera]|uniref:ATP-dependent zinc metalloprotease FTSH 10, mitochondrial-like n=1 Tax=Pistacia vera TaxID=55513 RepID=UPI00126373BC
DGRLGFWTGYLAAIGGQNDSYLSDLNHALANPIIRRFFSTEAPKNKKNYENFYPKEKKEIPKGNEQKSESKGQSASCLLGWLASPNF